jgi:hypothetical protein
MGCSVIVVAVLTPLCAGPRTSGDPKQEVSAPVLRRTFTLERVRGPADRTGIPGRIDHITYDPATKRLFIACVANGSLEVVDLESGTRALTPAVLSASQVGIFPHRT